MWFIVLSQRRVNVQSKLFICILSYVLNVISAAENNSTNFVNNYTNLNEINVTQLNATTATTLKPNKNDNWVPKEVKSSTNGELFIKFNSLILILMYASMPIYGRYIFIYSMRSLLYTCILEQLKLICKIDFHVNGQCQCEERQ